MLLISPRKTKAKATLSAPMWGRRTVIGSGSSVQEIMPKIEQHGREKHDMTLDDQTCNKVRNAIHKQAA
jgi:hypothetical protein